MNTDLRINLFKYKESDEVLKNVAGKSICFFTDSDIVHSSISLNKKTFEETVDFEKCKIVHGAKMTDGIPQCDYTIRYKKQLTDKQFYALQTWLEFSVEDEWPYNFLRLLSLMVVYPTRPLWKWINYVPFSGALYGEVCSTYVDLALYFIGIDALPGQLERYTAPGDFLKRLVHDPDWEITLHNI